MERGGGCYNKGILNHVVELSKLKEIKPPC